MDLFCYVNSDAELMTSYIPAEEIVLVPKKFTAFRDGSAHPAVLVLDEDGILHAVGDKGGVRQKANLSRAYNISAKIIDYVLRQATDGTVSLALATFEGGSKSALYLFFGLTADEVWSPPPNKLLHGDNLPALTNIFMTHSTVSVLGLGDLPALLFSHPNPDRVNETTVSPILVVQAGSSYKMVADMGWELQTNTAVVHDIELGSSAFGAGAFVLYTDHNSEKRVIYQVTAPNDSSSSDTEDDEPSSTIMSDFQVDSDATHIITYVDPMDPSLSVLLVIGSQITMYAANQFVKSKPVKAAVVPIDTLIDVKNIHVAQSTDKGYTDHITIWYVNQKGAAYYYHTTHGNFADGSKVQILPHGSCDHISGLLWELSEQETLVQSLVSFNKSTGKYDIWHQGVNTRFWDPHPLYTDMRNVNMEVKGYTARFHPVTFRGNRLPHANIHFYLSSTSVIYIDGKPEWVGLTGKWLRADATGTIEIFVPSNTLSSPAVLIDRVISNDTSQDLGVFFAEWNDLSAKPLAKMRAYQTVDQLRNAKTQDGLQVIPNSMDTQLLAQISDGITMGFQVYDDIVACAAEARAAATSPEEHATLTRKAVDFSSSCVDDLTNIHNWFHDGLKWAWGKIKKIAKGVWKIAVIIGNEIKEFVIDTAKKAATFIGMVIDALKLLIDLIIEWLGMLLNWEDIKTTAKSIHRWIDVSLYWGAAKADSLEGIVDDIFDNIVSNLESARGTQLTQSVDPPTDPSGIENKTHSVAFNYGLHKLLSWSPGSSSSMAIKAVRGPDNIVAATDQGIVQVVWDTMRKILGDIHELFNSLFSDFTDWEEWKRSPLEVLKRIDSDVIIGVVKVIRDVIEGMIKAVAAVIRNFQNWGNIELDIPILTALWKKLTGQPLSIFGAFAFALAFPTYFISKVVTGNAPPDVSGMPIDQWSRITSLDANSSQLEHSFNNDLIKFKKFSEAAAAVCIPTVLGVIVFFDTLKMGAKFDIWNGLNLLDVCRLALSTVMVLSPLALKSGFETKGSVQPIWPKVAYASDLATTGILGSCVTLRFCLGGSIQHDELSVVVNAANLFADLPGVFAQVETIVEEWNEVDGFEKGAEISNASLKLIANVLSVAGDVMNESGQPEIGAPLGGAAIGCMALRALVIVYKVYHDYA